MNNSDNNTKVSGGAQPPDQYADGVAAAIPTSTAARQRTSSGCRQSLEDAATRLYWTPPAGMGMW